MLNNFFTVADLNYAILALFSSFYLITIQNKSKNLYHLIIFFFALGTMAIAYFFSSNFINENLRFHRWITVSASLLGTLHLFYFISNYPKSNWKKIPKFIFYFLYGLEVILIILFIHVSLKVGKIYKFDGHFWDINEYKLGQIIGLFIILNGFLALFIGIIRSIQIKNARIPLFFLSIGILFMVIFPAVTNFLNRIFLITREEHQNIWAIFGNLGCFIAFVTYVNYTKERTTLLSKLYAISLTSILIILQFVNFFILQERDKLFDLIQNEKNRNIAAHRDYRPKEVKFILEIQPDLEYELIYNSSDNLNLLPYFENLKSEFALMYLQLSLINSKEIPKKVQNYIESYSNFIESIRSKFLSNQEVLQFFYNNKRKLQLLNQNIQNISDENFEKEYKNLFQKNQTDEIYKYFLKENIKSKEEALQLVPNLISFNQKRYFYIENNSFWNSTFIGYYYTIENKIYLILYDYFYYRIFIAEIADILFYIIFVSGILILLGYPIFFLESMLKPLKRLILGLQKVEEGDLSINIDISVNDELGYVIKIFNQMVRTLKEKNEKIEEYTNHLELKVIERTKELEKSLREIESLKEKQDGDYFLTSLLIKPLNSNEIQDSKNIKVNFILKQYKNFKFKKWESEIGGDFCTAKKIQLRNKNYSFIVNADAMGKSIQGAGGSLILGSVLEAIVERTNYQEEVKELAPEKWLKYTFVELHKVFESLDGAMLISILMLLIDEESGFLYFMNAEHPDLILYRNSKAFFIKPKKYLKKLGVYAEGLLNISTFQLLPGDILLLGSDGKDDIVIGKNEDGSRKINFDETLFLKIIEEAKGELHSIYNNLKERGEFIDDLSIIRIEYTPDIPQFNKKISISYSYKENFLKAKKTIENILKNQDSLLIEEAFKTLRELQQKHPENILIKQLLYKLFLLENKTTEAILILEDILKIDPSQEKVLYKLIKLLKRKKFYSKAAEYGEIYLLRNPDNTEILQILTEIYRNMNHSKYKKYEKFLQISNHNDL